MQLTKPKERIFKPFLLREPQKGFDLGTDVKLLLCRVQAGHKSDDGQLFNQGAIAKIRLPAFARGASLRYGRGAVAIGGRPDNRRYIFREAGHTLENGDGFAL